MRKVVGCLVIALVAAGCSGASAATSRPGEQDLTIRESPSPFREVRVNGVTAMIPDRWRPQPIHGSSDAERGFVASPTPGNWQRGRAPVEGMAAMWVDGTKVGVPSDYYYLAATGAALDELTHSADCNSTSHMILVNHRPAFADGSPNSPGDYMAMGQGVCRIKRMPTRWAYFVAAPGYGPVRQVGIPSSGLYVVVAIMPNEPRSVASPTKLLNQTTFGGASLSQFIAAARAA